MEQHSTRKSYKYRLMPAPEQDWALEMALLRCRTLSNVAIEQRKMWWGRGQAIGATSYQQATELPALKAACPEYSEVHSQVVQHELRRVERTYHAVFRRVANGKTSGSPRFQGRTRYHSFTSPQYGHGAVLDGSILSLSKIVRILVRLHRPPAGTPKTVIIAHEAERWCVSFSCTDVPAVALPLTGKATSVDVGLRVVLVTAGGDEVDNSRHYQKGEKQLANAHKRISRRKQGSKRWWKAVRQCGKKHQHVGRQRTDFHHRTALYLLRTYDVISLEDVRVHHLVRNHHLAKSISDAGWRALRAILTRKAADAGKRVVAMRAVPAPYTSQDCSGVPAHGSHCTQLVPKSLSVHTRRTHVCPSRGLVIDRDKNMVLNMLRAGQARQGAVAMAAVLN